MRRTAKRRPPGAMPQPFRSAVCLPIFRSAGQFDSGTRMLVCHCNVITQKEIEEAVVGLLDADPWQLIVPAKVYHALAKRGRCCGCFPNVVETIIRVTEIYHSRSNPDGEEIMSYLDRVRGLRGQYGRGQHAGRKTGHRAA
jgi:bacterioferritin-associated ferredoxin